MANTISIISHDKDFNKVNRDFLTPSFVVDSGKFQEEVQNTVYYFECVKMMHQLDTECNKDKDDRDEVKIRELKARISDLADYRKGDYVSCIYAFSMGIVSGTVGIAGFDNLFSDVKVYGEQYTGVEGWTDDRKKAFTSIKTACNNILSWKFNLAQIDADRGIYKTFVPEMSSRAVEMFINAVYGVDGRGSAGKKDEKIFGIKRRAMKKERAFILLCASMFKKYGCEIGSTPRTKTVDFIM